MKAIKIRPSDYIYKVITDLAASRGKRLAPTVVYFVTKGLLAEGLITQEDIDRPVVKVDRRGGKRDGAGRPGAISQETKSKVK
jgi:hypothetical protein